MMNVFALFLVVSSLVAVSIWSPSPDDQKQKTHPGAEVVIVKEGTRVVVVEYNKEGPGNTKVSISPQEAGHVFQKVPAGVDKTKEKFKEASEVLPNMGQGLSRGQQQHPQNDQNGQNGQRPSGSAKELICDAFGKCKEKIATKIGRSEQKVSEKAHEVQERAKETYSQAKEKVSEKAHEVQEGAKETYSQAKEKVSEKAHDIQDDVKNAYTTTKDKVCEKTHDMQESVKDAVKKAKHATKPTSDLGETILEDVVGNASKIEAAARDHMVQTARGERQGEENDGGDTVKSTLEEFPKQFRHDLVNRAYDAVNYMLPVGAVGSLMCFIHILGFATAYGVCVWVTFFSSFVLAGALPNQQFGIVQSKIYPFYFKTLAFCVGLTLLGHVLSRGEKVLLGKSDLFQGYALLVTLVMILINLIYLEPRATKVLALVFN